MAVFVGFGFGAIQAGLFLYEAFRSGAFERLVVAEVVPEVVAALRQAGGYYTVNIAHADRVEPATVGPVEAYDPAVAADRAALIDAIAQASELATAVPSVNFYAGDQPGSIHRLLVAGLTAKAEQGGPRAVVYAAENHNHAAEILAGQVNALLAAQSAAEVQRQVRFLNTVIGKMSGVKAADAHLAPITPGGERAFLVEDFNRILISQIDFPAPPFDRKLAILVEKENLLAFEEAKLYGHNALHSLAAYLGACKGLRFMSELSAAPDILEFVRTAVIGEPGAALVRTYAGVDPIFTPDGFVAYADDLLLRMVNPFLHDAIERVARDPARKLGWNDRLVGTMRVALAGGVMPRRFGIGAAAALAMWQPQASSASLEMLAALWEKEAADSGEVAAVLPLVADGWLALQQWQSAGYPHLEQFYRGLPGSG